MKKTRRQFLTDSASLSGGLFLSKNASLDEVLKSVSAQHPDRPNIILMLADDMGFSDIGCYGSEIPTPHLDRLAGEGLRFTQFYNNPRCCPSRASLMTGLYPHQAGFGLMTADYNKYPNAGLAYQGDLSDHCVTIAEVLRTAGYKTAMCGKWHLTPPEGVDKHNWPLQRGFDKFYGIIAGAANYYNPETLTRDNTPIRAEGENYYFTDALGENAVQYIGDFAKSSSPFFLYTAFTASHWPLHAPEATIARHIERYRSGWDTLRAERHARQIKMGIVEESWGLSPRDPRVPSWELAAHKEWEIRRMAVYAAIIDHMDQAVGRIMKAVDDAGVADKTLILFMADNGGNYEEVNPVPPNAKRQLWFPEKTRDGQPVVMGNKPNLMPGPETTYQSYGMGWGNGSNTPFRLYKHYAHEGGISTPLIAHWPSVIKQHNRITKQVGHETDIMATCLELAGVSYPTATAANLTPPLAGKSLLSVFQGGERTRAPIFWEHEGNCAMRDGKWKLVSQWPDVWELYDMEKDRTEMHNLADAHPEIVKSMGKAYAAWAKQVGVLPWPLPGGKTVEITAPKYLRDMDD